MSEPTIDEIRTWWQVFAATYAWQEENKEYVLAIRALIEHGPEVSRNDIEPILENEKTTNAENMDALMDYLEAKGIKIEVEEVAEEEGK